MSCKARRIRSAKSPRDMLQVVNVLNSLGSGSIDTLESSAAASKWSAYSPRLVDTNNDGRITPRDLLFLVNHFVTCSCPS